MMVLAGLLTWLLQLLMLLISIPLPGKVPLPVQSWIDSTGSGTSDDPFESINLFIQRTVLRLVFQYPVGIAVMLQLPVLFAAWAYMQYSLNNYRNRVFWRAA